MYNFEEACPCENYEKIYCEDCGQEIDGVNRTIAQEFHGICECLFSCSECAKRCPMCGELNCNCFEELKKEFKNEPTITKEDLENSLVDLDFDFDDFEFDNL